MNATGAAGAGIRRCFRATGSRFVSWRGGAVRRSPRALPVRRWALVRTGAEEFTGVLPWRISHHTVRWGRSGSVANRNLLSTLDEIDIHSGRKRSAHQGRKPARFSRAKGRNTRRTTRPGRSNTIRPVHGHGRFTQYTSTAQRAGGGGVKKGTGSTCRHRLWVPPRRPEAPGSVGVRAPERAQPAAPWGPG
jgi:hypothetical protein